MDIPEMVVPKKVIVYNPETKKRETWSWLQFQKHINIFTEMFENAGIDPADLVEEKKPARPKYDH